MFESCVSDYCIVKPCYPKMHINQSELIFNRPCIGYVLKGQGEFLWRGKKYTANKGDLIYIAKGTVYRSMWTGQDEVEWYSVSFAYALPSAYSSYKFQILRNYPGELLNKMYETYETSKFQSISYFYLLLEDLFKKMTPTLVCAKRTVIAKALNYIEQNYTKKITIEELAKMCGCSESYFFNAFKEVLGVSPIAYKHNLLVQQAIKYLAETNLSIDEISNTLGFSSPNYFRKIFTSVMGKSPKELRRK